MARLKAKNMAGTTLTADITAAATSFGVANASLLPDCPFRVTIYSPDPQATAYEIVEAGAKDEVSNTVSSVQRGLEGTTASAHFAGDYVESKWTAEMYDELETGTGAQAKADGAEIAAKAYAKSYADDNFEVKDSNIMRKNVAQTMTANLTANGGTDYSTSKVRNIIAIEDGTTEPTAENGALLVIYEVVV